MIRFPLLTLALLSAFIAEPVQAQQKTNTAAALPWRRQVEQRLEDQSRRLQALENRPAPVAPAPIINIQPAPAPIVIPGPLVEKHYYYPPRQFIPIDPGPKQIIPVDPNPKQIIPIDPDPKQKIPVDPKPKQPIPVDPNPKQIIPEEPKEPLQKLPVDPDPEPLQKLPAAGPPVGFQRFTVGTNYWTGRPSTTKALARPVK